MELDVEPQLIARGTLVGDLIGVFAGAWLGAASARRTDMDLLGYVVLGLVTGIGGGIVRDVLLQAGTPIALVRPSYLTVALIGAVCGYLFEADESSYHGRVLSFLDALMLGSFATAGSQRALDAALSPLPAVCIGVIAAVGGGVLRDILRRETPRILIPGPFYATSAFAASIVAVILTELHRRNLALLLGIVVGFVSHLLSIRFTWRLPGHRGPTHD